MARVAVVGVGAIGGALAGLLEAVGGHEITLCTRRPVEGLVVRTPEGDVLVKAKNVTRSEDAAAVDWVLVATKTYDAESAARWLPGLCAEGAAVAVVQNGVEHRERFRGVVAEERTLPVIIDCPVERMPDGSVLQRGEVVMQVEVGALGEEFAGLFAGSLARVVVTEDFVTAAWRKLCTNAAGAVSALMLKPAGVLRDEALQGVALDLVAECAAVARAEGATLAEDVGEQVLAGYRRQSPESVNSLLADRMAGRMMEVDARNGVIVRLGEKHGIPTPANRMAWALLTALAKG